MQSLSGWVLQNEVYLGLTPFRNENKGCPPQIQLPQGAHSSGVLICAGVFSGGWLKSNKSYFKLEMLYYHTTLTTAQLTFLKKTLWKMVGFGI